MWQLAHLASGALMGQQVNEPVVAFGLGVGIHLLIDKIPHYWPKPLSERRWFTVIDYLITIPVFYFALQKIQFNQSGLFWGVIGSLLVDILLVGVPFLHNGPIGKWHYKRQPHRTSPWFLLTDAAVIVICLIFLKS